jgi:hypothetical protein
VRNLPPRSAAALATLYAAEREDAPLPAHHPATWTTLALRGLVDSVPDSEIGDRRPWATTVAGRAWLADAGDPVFTAGPLTDEDRVSAMYRIKRGHLHMAPAVRDRLVERGWVKLGAGRVPKLTRDGANLARRLVGPQWQPVELAGRRVLATQLVAGGPVGSPDWALVTSVKRRVTTGVFVDALFRDGAIGPAMVALADIPLDMVVSPATGYGAAADAWVARTCRWDPTAVGVVAADVSRARARWELDGRDSIAGLERVSVLELTALHSRRYLWG